MAAGKSHPPAKATVRQIPKVVVHPRYGNQVVATGCAATPAEVKASYRYSRSVLDIYTESAVRGDPQRQNYAWAKPKCFYADVLLCCSKCRRKFIFFAREQQFWYEELGINIRTMPRFCWECAAENRSQTTAYDRYQRYTTQAELSEEELVQFGDDMVTLYEAGVLKRFQRLAEVRNALVRRAIPEEKWPRLRDLVAHRR